mmetsp:Transcript_1548/g.3957  ORF Transcript_1548/g.3957 Transcript_1548/m.3957 type:complete len:203 (+) Transcript_1548:398-1006(+)
MDRVGVAHVAVGHGGHGCGHAGGQDRLAHVLHILLHAPVRPHVLERHSTGAVVVELSHLLQLQSFGRQLRCPHGRLTNQHPQLLVQPALLGAGVQVVVVVPEGVLDFDGDEIQSPQDEDLGEGQDTCHRRRGDPRVHHEADEQPMNHEEEVARLRIREGERGLRHLQSVVECAHAVPQLLEASRQDGRRDAEHTVQCVLHHE